MNLCSSSLTSFSRLSRSLRASKPIVRHGKDPVATAMTLFKLSFSSFMLSFASQWYSCYYSQVSARHYFSPFELSKWPHSLSLKSSNTSSKLSSSSRAAGM